MSDDNPVSGVDEARALTEFSVTPSQLLQTLEHCLSSRDSAGNLKEQANVMVWGPMGIGKTDVCRSVGKLWGRRIVALHLPQFDPTDLKGIPVLGEDGKVKWVPSSFLPQSLTFTADKDYATGTTIKFDWPSAEQVMVHVFDAEGKLVAVVNDGMNPNFNDTKLKFDIDMIDREVVVSGKFEKGTSFLVIDKAIIFLDELSAAVPAVQNAALQLVLDKRVGEYDLPPYTPIVAAGNRESDQAFVSPMSMPLANRFMHLRLVHSLADWIEWAMINRVHPSILGYLQWRKSHLFDPEAVLSGGIEGDLGFPTPRSWAKLSEQMRGIDDLPDPVQAAVITGYIGAKVGQQFIAHRAMADLLPKTDDILQGKDVNIPEDLNVGAKFALATALCYAIADYHKEHYDDSKPDGIDNQSKEWRTAAKAFCEFIDAHLGSEMTILCVYIVSKHLEVPFTTMRGTNFTGFAKKYRDFLRKST